MYSYLENIGSVIVGDILLARTKGKPDQSLAVIPLAKREQIRKLLLEDNSRANEGQGIQPDNLSYSKIAYQLAVPVSAVRAVAKSLFSELRALDNARKDEFKRDLLTGSKLALAKILESIESGSMTERQLIYAFGVMADKFMALDTAGEQGQVTAATAGTLNEFAQSIVTVLQKAADRQTVIDVTPIEETDNTEPPDQ